MEGKMGRGDRDKGGRQGRERDRGSVKNKLIKGNTPTDAPTSTKTPYVAASFLDGAT
jgi:hypothetical protein